MTPLAARLLSICLLYGTSQLAHAGPDSLARTNGSPIVCDARLALKTAGKVFAAPLRFKSEEWITTGAIVAGTAILFAVDEPFRSLAQRNQSQFGDDAASVGNFYGHAPHVLIGAGAIYLGGLAFHDKQVRMTGLMLIESVTFAGVIASGLKVIIGRSRPYNDEGAFTYRGFQFRNERMSLPSGHSTVAFALSAVLAGKIRSTPATVGLYTLAALTAAARVYTDEHWVSDTFLGAAIGTVVGNAVLRLNEEGETTGLRLTPSPGGLKAELIF
ncbi:MAG TPA: phosphatase PAP2 family protein [Bacteroidota bacterium]|nr:phosphatase PAP2 family protein [Bacteroidota bacterium]